MSETPVEPVVVTHIISGDLWAGAEVQVFNLCKGLLKTHAVKPTAVVFNEGLLSERLRELGVEVDIADERRLGPFGIIHAIWAHCRRYRSQVVHTHGFKENILGILAKDLARVPRSIRTVHGNPETTFRVHQIHKRMIHKLDMLLGRFRQDYIVAVSTQLEERLKALFPGKVVKIFNFIDVDALRTEWPKTTKPEGGPWTIGIVGRLVQVKRVDLFLETLALLQVKGTPVKGVIIGEGPLETALRDQSRALGLSKLAKFAGFVDPVYREFCKLDVLMMPSEHEGMPMTLIEALALEIPVVGHDVGGITELLHGGRCGALVPSQSAEAYADSIAKILACLEQNSGTVKAGLAHVRNFYGILENSSKYLKLYELQ